ncbi:hypothetical protein BLOT_013372 [Blomia tropicalis]|nr:hypothetical protein BLOT_013372 [Blomia tropicalis]
MSMCKQRTMSGHRRIEYEVDDIGLIIEEWNLNSTTKMDDHHTNDEEEIGKYSVYINGDLVRQIELNTGKVSANNNQLAAVSIDIFNRNDCSHINLRQSKLYYISTTTMKNSVNHHILMQHQHHTLSAAAKSCESN